MESNQLNNLPNEDAVIEALTLTCEVDEHGTKRYRNKECLFHRIYGPAIIWSGEYKSWWYKNGKLHREDGPAITWRDGGEEYWIDNVELTKDEFIQWQTEHGIKPIE